MVRCNGCKKESDEAVFLGYHSWYRKDAYGIFTGYSCYGYYAGEGDDGYGGALDEARSMADAI